MKNGRKSKSEFQSKSLRRIGTNIWSNIKGMFYIGRPVLFYHIKAKWGRLSTDEKLNIRLELNYFKLSEMKVHPKSLKNNQYYEFLPETYKKIMARNNSRTMQRKPRRLWVRFVDRKSNVIEIEREKRCAFELERLTLGLYTLFRFLCNVLCHVCTNICTDQYSTSDAMSAKKKDFLLRKMKFICSPCAK